jgi:hypothetical protein
MFQIAKAKKLLDSEIRTKNFAALRYWAKGLYWHAIHPQVPDPVFVVGCSRSGTTVTYETIAASSTFLTFGYELPQLWNGLWGPAHNNWDSEAAYAENALPDHRTKALSYFYQRLGKGRVLDKSCINVMRVGYLNELFPNAQFVYIHRDGRDNVNSLIEGWRAGSRFALTQFLGDFPCEVDIDRGRFKEWYFFLPPEWRAYNHSSLEEVCAHQWVKANSMALQDKQIVPPERWIEIRYEDIFERPIEMFAGVFERLGVKFDDAIKNRCATLKDRPTSIVSGAPERQKWRRQNPEAIERILEHIRPLMLELGYDVER